MRDRRHGFWRGLEVLRGLQSRNVIIGLVMFATGAQVVRNMIVLEGLGVDISVFDAVALLLSADGASDLAGRASAQDFVSDAYAHHKLVGTGADAGAQAEDAALRGGEIVQTAVGARHRLAQHAVAPLDGPTRGGAALGGSAAARGAGT